MVYASAGRQRNSDGDSLPVVASMRVRKLQPDKVVRFLRALGKAMDLIRRDREKAITLGRSHGLRGTAIERKALSTPWTISMSGLKEKILQLC